LCSPCLLCAFAVKSFFDSLVLSRSSTFKEKNAQTALTAQVFQERLSSGKALKGRHIYSPDEVGEQGARRKCQSPEGATHPSLSFEEQLTGTIRRDRIGIIARHHRLVSPLQGSTDHHLRMSSPALPVLSMCRPFRAKKVNNPYFRAYFGTFWKPCFAKCFDEGEANQRARRPKFDSERGGNKAERKNLLDRSGE